MTDLDRRMVQLSRMRKTELLTELLRVRGAHHVRVVFQSCTNAQLSREEIVWEILRTEGLA